MTRKRKIILIVVIIIIIIIILILIGFVFLLFGLNSKIVRYVTSNECYKLNEYQCKENINCFTRYKNIKTFANPSFPEASISKYSYCEKISEEFFNNAEKEKKLCINTGGTWQERDMFNKLGACQCSQIQEDTFDEQRKYYHLSGSGCLDLKTFCDNVPETRCKITNQAYVIRNNYTQCSVLPNSVWRDYRSECTSYFSSEIEAGEEIGQIKSVLSEYYEKQIQDIDLNINKETDSFILVFIQIKDSLLLNKAVLVKVNEQWQLVFSGEIAGIPCQVMDQYNIPPSFINKCKN